MFKRAYIEYYFTSSYVGFEHRFSQRLDLKALAEDVRAWRIYQSRWGISQNLRPAGSVDFIPKRNWDLQFSSAYSSVRGFHIYDATQNGVSISYSRPLRRMFNDNSTPLALQYPIRFSAGVQQETFFNFPGAQNQTFRPYAEIINFLEAYTMKICLVATFPPSGRQLNEYAFYIANELRRHRNVELTILADELTSYDFVTDENGKTIAANELPELTGFNLIRCWKFGSLSNPARLLNTIRKLKPDVVWYHLVFSTFATPDKPVTAFAGLSAPALTRGAGFYTHVTLHHIIEHVDFSAAGVRRERLFRLGAEMATKTLLRANSVSVLLPGYYRTLVNQVSRSKRAIGHSRNICAGSRSAGLFETRQSRSTHFGLRALGNL